MDIGVRERSRRALAAHGLSVPTSLPAIDPAALRPLEDIRDRLFCLNAVAAVAYGFDADKARSWLDKEHLSEQLSQPEIRLLERGQGNRDAFRAQVEGMWVLAWALSIVSEIDFWRDCSPTFVTLLPNLKAGESVTRTMAQAELRTSHEVMAACDLSYCLHWIIRESMLRNGPLPRDLAPYVVIERRRALEWMLSKDAWDMVDLST